MTRRTRTAKRFTPTELGNGKVITAVRDEFGVLEYEATLDGEVIGYYQRFSLAEEAVNDAFTARVQAVPATMEEAVVAALDDLEAEHRQYEATARAAGLKEEAAQWVRAANAYANARAAYLRGIRPEQLGKNAYILPSQRPGGESHLLRMDGDWTCSCAAGSSAHWAKMLIIGLERALDDMQRFDDPTEPAPAPDYSAAEWGRRLAAARQLAMQAA